MEEVLIKEYDVTIYLKDDYTTLVTREIADYLLNEIIDKLKNTGNNATLILNFEQVKNIDYSFFDQFLNNLIQYQKEGKLGNKYIIGINLKSNRLNKFIKKEDINTKLHNKGYTILCIDKDNNPYWLGVIDKNALKILESIWKNNKISLDQLILELDMSSIDIDNIIKNLIDNKLIKKEETKSQKIKYFMPIINISTLEQYTFSIEDELKHKIIECDAIEKGCHIELPSGYHAEEFLHLSKVLKEPRFIGKISLKIANLFGDKIDAILTTETPNNILLAYKISDLVKSSF